MNLIEDIKALIWVTFRNISIIKLRTFSISKLLYCYFGFHKMKRGFGWSGDKRMDVCLRNGCNYSKWHKDKIGNELIRVNITVCK